MKLLFRSCTRIYLHSNADEFMKTNPFGIQAFIFSEGIGLEEWALILFFSFKEFDPRMVNVARLRTWHEFVSFVEHLIGIYYKPNYPSGQLILHGMGILCYWAEVIM